MVTMNRGIIIATLMAAALPLRAGIVLTLNGNNATPTSAGAFAGGTTIFISASGLVSLDGPFGNPNVFGQIITNPDGSLSGSPSLGTAYQYFLPGAVIPDGTLRTNNFSGGGANWDALPDGHSAFAPEGTQAVANAQAAGVIRLGALAGTFVTNPTANDWFLVGNGGAFLVPNGGATLLLVVADTFYPNNFGSFTVNIDTVPEPAAVWL